MLATLATISSTNQAFAADKKRTELTISVSKNGPAKTDEGGTWVPLTISGRLTSGGSGVAGATIILNSDGEEIDTANTDSGGHYTHAASLKAEKHEIDAWTQHIPSDYNESSASTTIQLP
jgi:hypothetical protein